MKLARVDVSTGTITDPLCQNITRQNPVISAALYFELEKRPLQEVLMKVKKQSEVLERELHDQKIISIFQLFKSKNIKKMTDLNQILNVEVWSMFPPLIQNEASNAMLESIARCSRRQIHCLQLEERIVISDMLYGSQFHPETAFYLVNFIHNSKLSFVVTAVPIEE